MSEILIFKNRLINELWLLNVKRGGNIFYPRKKNKKMKLLTLTNDRNFQEIIRFEEENITTREYVVVWTHSHIKKLRLETELSPAKVLGATRYERSTSSSSFSISELFPFDVINLDFSSQDPDLESGRIEKEIQSLEKTIGLQREYERAGFILIYTTLLNSNNLNYESIATVSNTIYVPGWSGLSLEEFSSHIADQKEKMRCVESVMSEICSKYNYNVRIEKKYCSLGDFQKYLYSIAGLLNSKR